MKTPLPLIRKVFLPNPIIFIFQYIDQLQICVIYLSTKKVLGLLLFQFNRVALQFWHQMKNIDLPTFLLFWRTTKNLMKPNRGCRESGTIINLRLFTLYFALAFVSVVTLKKTPFKAYFAKALFDRPQVYIANRACIFSRKLKVKALSSIRKNILMGK